jgi:hypothetical protein
MLKDCGLTDNRVDQVLWTLENKKLFTTKSLYYFLTDRGVKSRVAGFIWKSKVPLKIKFFLWQLLNDKLQVAVNLAKKDGRAVLYAAFVIALKLLITSSLSVTWLYWSGKC